ncbi:ribonuclease Y [Candidatus Wolfebacteria bacterium RIFCSPLOWO2_01_FULL_45_19]|uniref:Ribonuclease Y n=1 Tax=Candidatus Wolfebacteria bacterium RIFCSPLOWO2_01_FULL_45_19 TaxID=1802557 RepID=A0A1F8DRB5_9BACT|nr:MAG: Ribonuclease Y [Parcubacteria group bacterium GW2011_GWB1_45_9]OGM90982.1 MAG: ribonuclease Y [Candidatus Wolfebacteria bacterium RIFCSPLOWO2_01_FULL_45_19]
MFTQITPLEGGLVLAVGIAVGYLIRHFVVRSRAKTLEQKVNLELESAKKEAQEIVAQAKDKSLQLIEDAKNDERERKAQLARMEERVLKYEKDAERRADELRTREAALETDMNKVKLAKAETDEKLEKAIKIAEKTAGFTKEEARNLIIKNVEDSHRQELAQILQKLENERREEVEKRSLSIITTAVQRYARSHVSEITTSVFHIPSEDLKGKIIGREGRNVRTLERLTGVEFIIDETPEAIVISSFDPVRREIAKMALEKLIKDGRIQPAKIEEKVEEARKELEKKMYEIGEAAAFEVGVLDLPKEVIQLIGRLHFRTSFGQNVLTHSIEMAYISAMLAAELGANVEVAKRGALVHDIGKAIDHEVQGTHVELGRKLLKKYGVDDAIIDAMQSHHEDYPYATPESYIVTAADVLSAARPGARRGTVENYIKRLEDLEKIAGQFEGVKMSYAISAGRELRVFVVPEKIDDFGALQLAKNIANKIQTDLRYPGEIKVNVIREMRAVEYAR